jgi:hypothetical protein
MYYHGLKDQFGDPIGDEGAGTSAGESVWYISGSSGWKATSPGDYHNCAADPPFQGGLAVPDTLNAPALFGQAVYGQSLTAGGWNTTPQYTITFDTLNLNIEKN